MVAKFKFLNFFSPKVPVFIENPQVRILSNNQSSEEISNTIEVEFDWSSSFVLNDQLDYFELIFDQKSIYTGNETKFRTFVNLSSCSSIDDYDNESNLKGIQLSNMTLRVVTRSHSFQSPMINIKFNCSSKILI